MARGTPGANPVIRLRGSTNLGIGGSQPLLVVDGVIYFTGSYSVARAVDAKTGKLVWSVDTLPDGSFYTVTGAPRVFDGKVIIGVSGGEAGIRGHIDAAREEERVRRDRDRRGVHQQVRQRVGDDRHALRNLEHPHDSR